MKRKWITVIGSIILVFLITMYINERYLFHPFVFSKDAVTSHSWNDYETPLTLTYYHLENDRSQFTIKEEAKIRDFLEAMKNAPHVEGEAHIRDIRGALQLSNSHDVLLEVYFYTDYWHVLKNKHDLRAMTSSLERLIGK